MHKLAAVVAVNLPRVTVTIVTAAVLFVSPKAYAITDWSGFTLSRDVGTSLVDPVKLNLAWPSTAPVDLVNSDGTPCWYDWNGPTGTAWYAILTLFDNAGANRDIILYRDNFQYNGERINLSDAYGLPDRVGVQDPTDVSGISINAIAFESGGTPGGGDMPMFCYPSDGMGDVLDEYAVGYPMLEGSNQYDTTIFTVTAPEVNTISATSTSIADSDQLFFHASIVYLVVAAGVIAIWLRLV